MFIALQKYGTLSWQWTEMIPVFDTDDGTLELVSVYDIDKYGIDVKNYIKNSQLVKPHGLYSAFVVYRIDCSVLSFSRGKIRFKDWNIEFNSEHYLLTCNDKKFPSMYICRSTDLRYMFEYKGMLVIRFMSPQMNGWYSVIIKKQDGVVAVWDSKERYGDNKLIASVDMTVRF